MMLMRIPPVGIDRKPILMEILLDVVLEGVT